MVFSSFVFLLAFLPIVLLIYAICPRKLCNVVLLLASLLFYAWGEPIYVLLMFFSILQNYVSALLIEKFKEKEKATIAKVVLVVCIVLNVGMLGFFKYADFVVGTINSISGIGLSLFRLALPIGISFYTFQTMSYTIDVYWGKVKAQRNIINFATYVTLFSQLIAGPIVQYKTVAKEIDSRKVRVSDFAEGAFRFSVGLAKKVLIANQVGALFDTIAASSQLTVASAWLGAIAYTFQIYFDFSGYSDMAIGLGRMFGFHFLENFNYPYMSKTITEFWRRWHISLSSWFKEYVYIPLGGNKKGMARQILNIAIVWVLTGLWHGANWNFVLWGVYYGALLILEKVFLLKVLDKIPNFFGHIYTMFLVVIGWTIFSQTDFSAMGRYLKAMFGFGGVKVVNQDFVYYLTCHAVVLVIAVLASLDYNTLLAKIKLKERLHNSIGGNVIRTVVMVALLVLSFAFLVGDSYNPFLYFRF